MHGWSNTKGTNFLPYWRHFFWHSPGLLPTRSRINIRNLPSMSPSKNSTTQLRNSNDPCNARTSLNQSSILRNNIILLKPAPIHRHYWGSSKTSSIFRRLPGRLPNISRPSYCPKLNNVRSRIDQKFNQLHSKHCKNSPFERSWEFISPWILRKRRRLLKQSTQFAIRQHIDKGNCICNRESPGGGRW